MSTKQNVSTYAKKLFSEVEPQAIIIDADNVSREDLMNVINEATDSVEEETGSRLYAELYRDNFTSRLFAEVEKADQNGGGEIDLDKAAEDAIDDTNKQLEETEETKKQSYMSKYFSGLEDENYEGDVIDEGNLIESEVRAQALYEAGFNDALRYFSEVEDEDGDEDEDEVTEEEKVVAQSALANDYFTVWTKVFADAKEEGASDTEAAAEATEEASKATGIAEEDEDEETKVQSYLGGNPYFSTFIRVFSEAKEDGASDEEATVEASQAALDEAGVDSAVVDNEEVKKHSMPEFTGEEFDDEDEDLIDIKGKEALKDTKDAEEAAEEVKTQSSLENQVEDLMDVSGFRVQSKIDEELEELIK
jgi:hypothetical protein